MTVKQVVPKGKKRSSTTSTTTSAVPIAEEVVPVVEVDATPIADAIPISEVEATPIALPVSPGPLSQPETCRIVAPATLPEGATIQAVLDGVQFTARVPRGGVLQGEVFETLYPKKIRVVAPSSLNAGDRFEAEVEGIRFWATVPAGGVREGDIFEHIHPSVAPIQNPKHNNRYNKWRTGLCDCCNGVQRNNCGLCCMGTWCQCLLNAQLMQRMNLGVAGCPKGRPHRTNSYNVYWMHVGITITLIVLLFVTPIIQIYVVIEEMMAVLTLATFLWTTTLFVAMVCARKSMREHYNLEGVCCIDGDCVDDFCVTYWCACCSLIQMANHTHDPNVHSYNCCSSTGLDRSAPPCVVV